MGQMQNPIVPPPGATGAPGETAVSSTASTPAPKNRVRARERLSALFTWFGFDPPGRWLAILTIFVLVDILVLSWIQVIAYNSYYTFSQDFGSFTQMFYTTTHDHLLLYYTSNIPSGSTGTFMAVHFAPLIFLLLPFYALAPGPATLLVMKIVVLAAGAFPAYGIASRRLGSPRWGLLLGTAYLVSPITMTLNWVDFDLEVFLPFLVLCAIYLLLRRRYFAFLIAWLLALATIETSVPFLLLFAAIALLGSFWGPGVLSKEDRVRERIALSTAVILAVIWLGLAYLVVHSYSPVGGAFGTSYASRYTVLGAQSFLQVLPQAILHPGNAGAALQYQGSDKIVYVLMLLGCFALLPLFGELRYLLPPVAWIALALLSNVQQLYSFGSQYLGYVSPFLFVGAVGGIAYLRPWVAAHLGTPGGPATDVAPSPGGRRRRWTLPRTEDALLPGVVVVAVVVTVGVGNPFLTHPAAGLSAVQFGFPTSDSHAALLDRIMALIPPSAGVLTTDHLFPQLSDRIDAFVLPPTELFSGSNSNNYNTSLNGFMSESNYVLLDYNLDPFPSQLIQGFGTFGGFGVEAAGDGIFLLERGWSGPPLPGFSIPTTTTYTSSGWASHSRGVAVNPSNQTFEYPVPRSVPPKANVTLWNGPVVSKIDPGMYALNVTYLLAPAAVGPLFAVQIVETPIILNITPYLVTSSGHHDSYNSILQPAVTLTSITVFGTSANQGKLSAGTASLSFEVSQLGNVKSVGITSTGGFWVLVTGFTLTWLGPPSNLDLTN
jgi:uncharacterized membrane protein